LEKRNFRFEILIFVCSLKSKDEEWRESKKNFERFWKEQSEKYYLKSLDYMGINCKNSDARIIRNRYLLNEIESIKEEVKTKISFASCNFSIFSVINN
jgi:paired amphipathic helix protein Sin3a